MRLLLETLAAPAAYAVLVSQLRQIPPKQLDPLIRLRRGHNVLLAVYSGVVAVIMAVKLAQNDRVRTLHDLVCVSSPGESVLWLESKVLEWFDTVLLFAAGRSPSTLHLVHHAITPSLVLLSVAQRANPTPVYDVAVGLNAWCHLWQYLYYAWPGLFLALKMHVTRMQIAQHATVLSCIGLALYYRQRDGPEACDAPLVPYGLSLLGYAFFLFAFMRFYWREYVAKKRA